MSEARSALVARVEAGDRTALPLLMESFRREMVEHINARLPIHLRNDVAEDIVQNAFHSLLPGLDGFAWRGPEAFAGWLRTAVECRFKDWCRYIRRLQRDHGRVEPWTGDASDAEGSAADSDTPLRQVSRRDRDEQLHRVMNAVLTPEQAEAVRLRFIEHLSELDAAAVLGCAPKAVTMRCQRALKALREAMPRASDYLSSR